MSLFCVAPGPLLRERLQRDRKSAIDRGTPVRALLHRCCPVLCMFSMVFRSDHALHLLNRKANTYVRSCHVAWNISPSVASFGNRLDFCGIVLLMWGASLPSIHFAFVCDPTLKITLVFYMNPRLRSL